MNKKELHAMIIEIETTIEPLLLKYHDIGAICSLKYILLKLEEIDLFYSRNKAEWFKVAALNNLTNDLEKLFEKELIKINENEIKKTNN